MTRQLNHDKRRIWLKRFERFRASGLSISKFCESERVSVQSFYYWSRQTGSGGNKGTAEDHKRVGGHPKDSFRGDETPHGDSQLQQPRVHFRFASGVEVFIPADCLESLRCILECLERPNQSDSFQQVLLSTR